MIKILLITFALLTLANELSACLWVDGEQDEFEKARSLGILNTRKITLAEPATPRKPRSSEIFDNRAAKIEKAFKKTRLEKLAELQKYLRNDTETNAAVKHIYSGNVQAAIQILERLEQSNPKSYIVQANLGTAYELTGQDEKALRHITMALELNSKSHYGTEWLHMLILERKINNNPKHLLPFDQNSFSRSLEFEFHGKKYSVSQIHEALLAQLKERMIFVKPKDAIVADLLYTLTIIEAKMYSLELAEIILNIAMAYKTDEQKHIDVLHSELKAHLQNLKEKEFE